MPYFSKMSDHLYPSQVMLSSDALDIRIIGDIPQRTKISKPDHFVIMTIDGKKMFESTKALREPAPQWKDRRIIQFAPASVIEFVIYRQSRRRKWVKHTVAQCNARGGEFLQIGGEKELVDKDGNLCLAVHFNISIQPHSEFMKGVKEDVAQLSKVKGIDAAQKATTLVPKIGAALEKLFPVIDKLAGAHPIMNASWMVLSSAIKMAQNQKKEDNNVRGLVDSLCEMAGAASACPDLKKIEGTSDVAEELGKASLEAAIIVHDYANPSVRGHAKFLARIFAHQSSDISSRIADSQTRCEGLTKKLMHRVAIEAYVVMKDVQHSDKKSAIHAWMKSPDTSPNYNAARRKHQSGTGSWFFNDPQFSEWREQPGSTMWLHGGPGCGKTILCSSVIANVITFCEEKPLARGSAYFFFDGTRAQSETLTYDGLIRSIITQLSDRCGDKIPNALVDMYDKCDTGHWQPLDTQLEETLAGVLATFESTYIIIDSLDECAEKADLLEWIRSVASKTSGNIHLMLTSRPEPEVERCLIPLPNLHKISIRGDATVEDIRAYLDVCLADPTMITWDKRDKRAIKKALSEGSGGRFRWVFLQIEAVKACTNETELNAQLKALPKGLDDAYAQIFERSKRPEDLLKLMHWLAFSEDPLTAVQLAKVMAFDFATAKLPSYDPELRCCQPEDIWRICNGLVTELQGKVKLAHFSVKEYFVERIKAKAEAHSSTSEQFSHSIIAQTCLAQLLRFDKPGVLDENLLGPGDEVLLIVKIFASPSTTWSHALLSWVRLLNLALKKDIYLKYKNDVLGHTLRSYRTQRLRLDASPLFYACFAGSVQAVQCLISDGAHVNSVGRQASTRPLLKASEEGHIEIARLLLENEADVDVEGGRYGTALQAACAEGHLELAVLLLDKGANVNVERGRYGTALRAACAKGHLELAALLLDKGANVDVERGFYGTALQAACAEGHLELATLLLDKGAKVNVVGGYYGTALQAACAQGHLELALMLLDQGANVDVVGGDHGTALQAACMEGHREIAELLRERGAAERLEDSRLRLRIRV
ncbi:hypothetical protein HWV62_45320 [Athelia sp. TMB]|nr:hypothetical protein HWV62_45320 [Athelia sp. TMB]